MVRVVAKTFGGTTQNIASRLLVVIVHLTRGEAEWDLRTETKPTTPRKNNVNGTSLIRDKL